MYSSRGSPPGTVAAGRLPRMSGRMPKGSRNASSPYPAIRAIEAYDPSTRSCTRATARKTWSGSRSGPVISDCSSEPRMLTSSSVSLLVLR